MVATDRLPRQCSLVTGVPKRRFDTRAEAKEAAPGGHRLWRIYRCAHCDYFHLAHRRRPRR